MTEQSGRLRALVTAPVLAVLLSACGGEAPDEPTDSLTEPPSAVPSADGSLTILHPYTGDADRAGFDAIVEAFTTQNPDIAVHVESATDIDQLVRAGIAAGTPADIAIYPRMDLLAALVDEGLVRPLDDALDIARLEEELVDGLLDLVRVDGRISALPLRLTVKSLVWYSPSTFEARGYRTPDTWSEMMTLGERMIADGLAPWCIGIESAGATGWVVTDWVEDILLRTSGVDAFDAWVRGDLAFASDEVRSALEAFLVPIWTDDDAVAGGRAGIATESVGASALGILGEDPECGLHRQAHFIELFYTSVAPEARFGVDYDFFALPPIVPGLRPVLGGGDFAVLLSGSPEAMLFMQFLALPESGRPWAERGGFLSPFAPVLGASSYPADSSRRASEILAHATAFRTDGSDRMPRAVGSAPGPGSFWTEMTAWVTGDQSLVEALDAIDALYASVR